MTTYLTAEAADAGERLDAFLSASLEELSRSRAQQLIEEGLVTLEGGRVRKNRRVSPGESYRLELPETLPAELKPEDIPLDILYEDGDLIVLNKPKGLVVHPAPGHPVAGDPLYGGGGRELGLGSQCLHARGIRFRHPSTGEEMAFECPLPEEFTRALSALRALA